MDENSLQALVASRSGTEQRVYEALRKHGRMTDRGLRDLLHSPGSGPRDALAKLLPLGVVRHAGKAATKGNPMQYEATPAAEVEEAEERFAARKPRKTRRRQASPGSRLADLREMEPGDCRKWYPARDQILATLPVLANTVKMAFWESVPPEELRLALAEIEELHEAAGEALAAGRERVEHEKYKTKLEKMSRTRGRTHGEMENADRISEKLRHKVIPS